jgi:hypothetical protein
MHEPEDPETALCPPVAPGAASGLAPAYVAAPVPAAPGAPTAAAGLVDPTEPTPAVHALLVMLDSATDFGVVELENALGALMKGPAPTSAEQRVAELSALSQLLESELAVRYAGHRIAPVQVSQRAYDATRPPGAPTAETLIKRHGGEKKDGWSWACRAAWGLLPDGRKTKPGCGWASGLRGRKRGPRSDRDLVIRSIRECAFELLRRPSSNVYIEWLAAHRRRADSGPGGGRASNPHRRASIPAVYQQFPRGWTSALAAADITDAELADARAKLLAQRSPAAASAAAARAAASTPTPAQRLAGLDAEQLASLGLDERTRERLLRKGFGELRVKQAAALAHALRGSMEWLVGADIDPGEPADPSTRFDPDALRAAAKRSDIKLEALRAKARLDVSGWRAVMTRKREPTLAQVQRWAASVRSDAAALLATT